MSATHGEGAYGNATGVTTPTDHKMAQVSDFVKTGVNTIRPGLLWDGNATVITGKANMSYDVRAFSIVTQRSATSGVMKWANDATVNVVTTAAPGSNSRYDVVYAWHREYSIDGVDSNPVIGVIQGTSAASPTVPALTSFPGGVELARILVPAGVTATNSGTTITQTAPFTAASGGVVELRNITERDAWTTALDGQLCHVIATEQMFAWLANATTPHWQLVAGKPDVGAITLNAAFKTNTGSMTPQTSRSNGRCFLDGAANILANSTTIPSNTNVTFGTITDATFRPATTQVGIMRFGTGFGSLTVNTDGTIVFQTASGGTFNTDTVPMGAVGVNWIDKRA